MSLFSRLVEVSALLDDFAVMPSIVAEDGSTSTAAMEGEIVFENFVASK